MYREHTITVVIPCLNEEEAIGKVLSDVPDFVEDIIVVDNNSTDRTAEIAESMGALPIYEALLERDLKVGGKMKPLEKPMNAYQFQSSWYFAFLLSPPEWHNKLFLRKTGWRKEIFPLNRFYPAQ